MTQPVNGNTPAPVSGNTPTDPNQKPADAGCCASTMNTCKEWTVTPVSNCCSKISDGIKYVLTKIMNFFLAPFRYFGYCLPESQKHNPFKIEVPATLSKDEITANMGKFNADLKKLTVAQPTGVQSLVQQGITALTPKKDFTPAFIDFVRSAVKASIENDNKLAQENSHPVVSSQDIETRTAGDVFVKENVRQLLVVQNVLNRAIAPTPAPVSK